MRRLGIALLLASACAVGASLEDNVRGVMAGTPETSQAFWGIRVVDAKSGDVVFSENENRFFVPASNTKLFTTALALSRLGPDYRFHTRVEASNQPDAKGCVRDLRLIGGGDPNLSARIIPYVRDKAGPDPLTHIQALADKIVAGGIRAVTGDIIGDDTAFAWEPYPDGWAVDDPTWEYGAPVSALTVNDNAFTLVVQPGTAAGEPAVLALRPVLEHLVIHNRTVTVSETAQPGKLMIERLPGSRELVVSGTVNAKAPVRELLLAVDDPALFAAEALRDALLDRGVRIDGEVRAAHRRADEAAPDWSGIEVARLSSAPLAQILQVINKVSQNLHTEMVLREVARVKTGFGTREGGLAAITEFLGSIGVAEKQYNFEDASGLSRLTLVTPATVSKLLLHMYNTPLRYVWLSMLPVGGQDGTLATRFDKSAGAVNIRAKTGSISHVSSLSGYALRTDGSPYVFSILVNNYNCSTSVIRKAIDRVALALLE